MEYKIYSRYINKYDKLINLLVMNWNNNNITQFNKMIR